MTLSLERIENEQRSFCSEQSAHYVASSPESMLGFARSTQHLIPLNGLRHPLQGNTNGWYLWCGEQFSDASDFFHPVHARHIYEDYPEVVKLLGLPPGYRFLLAGDHLDVWYDESLLNI
jgi:hypothetical protein